MRWGLIPSWAKDSFGAAKMNQCKVRIGEHEARVSRDAMEIPQVA